MDNIRALWMAAATALGVTSIQLKSVEVEIPGETAVEIGRATIGIAPSRDIVVKYVVVWKLEAGSWK